MTGVTNQTEFYELISITANGEILVKYPKEFDNIHLSGETEYLNWLLYNKFCTKYEVLGSNFKSNVFCGLNLPPVYPIKQHKPIGPRPGFCRGRKNL